MSNILSRSVHKVFIRLKRKPRLKEGLEFCFKDLDGYSYYKFPDETLLPLARIAVIQNFILEATRGMTKDELYKLLDMIDAHVHKGLHDPRNAAKVAGVVHEIRLREQMINNEDLYYNYLAACYIREDEKVEVYNLQCQKEKVQAFKKGATRIDSFFFHLPELKKLCELLNISTGSWTELMKLSMTGQLRKERAIDILK